MVMNRISVFCGSSSGSLDIYTEQARMLGQVLAQRKIGLVYGGARVGLMGAIADGALSENGKVTGVLPRFLQLKEIAHEGLTELILVDSMHERKTLMNELCDGVIAMPGGFGTLEEFFEMLTWGQLGLHKKPMGILNVNGFYDDLILLVTKMVNQGFLREANRQMILIGSHIDDLLDQMENYVAPAIGKWISRESV
jgi:uncharacterized protein (TIGR00730 family)